LIANVQAYDRKSRTPIVRKPGSLPTEAVFEKGFYLMDGVVRFDQAGTDQAIFS